MYVHAHENGQELIRKLHPVQWAGARIDSCGPLLPSHQVSRVRDCSEQRRGRSAGYSSQGGRSEDRDRRRDRSTQRRSTRGGHRFGGGLLQSQDAQPEAMARSGPLADPRDLSDKMDRLENMVSSILAQLNAAQPDRLSGDTIVHTGTTEKVGSTTPSSPASASSGHQLPANTLADHPAYHRV